MKREYANGFWPVKIVRTQPELTQNRTFPMHVGHSM